MKNENQDESRKNTIAGISSGDVFVSGVEKTMNSNKKIPSGILEKPEEKRRELSGLQKSNPDQEWITRRNQELRNREELNKERIRFLNEKEAADRYLALSDPEKINVEPISKVLALSC